MLCRNCGSQIPDNSKFCVNCGIKIEAERADSAQKRVISDRHYSLEEIAAQQKEHNLSGINQQRGVNLSKTPSENSLKNLIHSEPSPFSPLPEVQSDSENDSAESTTPPLMTDNEPYKMKSAGFPDEQEPVKRPPISEPIVPNNNFSDGTNINNSSTGFSSQNNPVNNNFSFGGTSTNNADTGFSNQNNSVNNNFSFGGTSTNNTNTGFSNQNNAVNNNFSFGNTSTNNADTGFSNQNNAVNNNFSFGGTSTNNTNTGFSNQNNSVNNNFSFGGTNNNSTYNAYSPTAKPNHSDGNSKAAKLLIVIAVIIGIAMVFAIIFMLISGYYKTDPTSQTAYKNSATTNSSIPSGSIEFSNLVYSNHLNCSIATEDNKGNVYYADENGCINRIDSTGNSTIIYSADSFPTYLNWYDGRLYFICDDIVYKSTDSTSTDNQSQYAETVLTTYNKRICSISTDGTSADLKTHTTNKAISAFFVSNGYMYYAAAKYDSDKNSSTVFRQNINTKKSEEITVISNSTVMAVYEYNGSVYVPFYDTENYVGQMIKIDENDFSKQEYINTPTGTPYDYFYITIQNDRFYFVNCNKKAEYSIYSMDMNGNNGTQITSSTKCKQIAVYGDYIYYTTYSGNSDNGFTLYRIKTDGTENTLIKDKDVEFMSFAGNRIYYIDSESGTVKSINLDGSETTIPN